MIVAIVLLVTMSAYFSATETAFSCMNKIRMKSRAESGDHRDLHSFPTRRSSDLLFMLERAVSVAEK